MNASPSVTPAHCKVEPKFSLRRPIYLLDLQIPVAKTPCSIPLEDWPLCYADECYLNAQCASYAGSHPRFVPRKPVVVPGNNDPVMEEWD